MLTESGDIAFHGPSLRSVEKTAYEVLTAKVFRASSISSQNSQITEGVLVIGNPHPRESAAGVFRVAWALCCATDFDPGQGLASRRIADTCRYRQRCPLRKRKQEESNEECPLKRFDFICGR